MSPASSNHLSSKDILAEFSKLRILLLMMTSTFQDIVYSCEQLPEINHSWHFSDPDVYSSWCIHYIYK